MGLITPAATETPIRSTIERVASTFQYLNATAGAAAEGWELTSDVIHSPETVNQWLDQVFEVYGMDDRQVAASFLVLGYFWYPAVAALGCYLLDGRLPDMRPDNIALNPFRGVCFVSPHFYALPDDPAAGHPHATVVQNCDELRGYLMQTLTDEHASPLFSTLRSVAPYGLPAMRANYLDRVASAIVWLAEQLGDNDISRREVPAFMQHAGPKTRTGVIELKHEGRSGVFLKRGGCCLNYRLPGREKCDTCSLIPMQERHDGLKESYLSGEFPA